jgi:hypothetical protein
MCIDATWWSFRHSVWDGNRNTSWMSTVCVCVRVCACARACVHRPDQHTSWPEYLLICLSINRAFCLSI